eukprot:12085879-Alexandrium_andersonii.AAC.1
MARSGDFQGALEGSGELWRDSGGRRNENKCLHLATWQVARDKRRLWTILQQNHASRRLTPHSVACV